GPKIHAAHGLCARAVSTPGLWRTELENLVYTHARGQAAAVFLPARPHEADIPAQRSASEEEARLSRAHVDACRPADPQAPPREGPEAALRLTASAVQRRYRLSRSRDFDAVYRH